MYKIALIAQKYISTLGSGGTSEKQSEVSTGQNESEKNPPELLQSVSQYLACKNVNLIASKEPLVKDPLTVGGMERFIEFSLDLISIFSTLIFISSLVRASSLVTNIECITGTIGKDLF